MTIKGAAESKKICFCYLAVMLIIKKVDDAFFRKTNMIKCLKKFFLQHCLSSQTEKSNFGKKALESVNTFHSGKVFLRI